MTLVLGVNLSDRVYLAADTQVTVRQDDGTKAPGSDAQLKIDAISSHMMVGCAGNAVMAAYIVREIKKSGICNLGIYDFETKLQEILPSMVGEYLVSSQKVSYNKARIIMTFAGIDLRRNKILDMKRYMQLAERFQELKQLRISTTFGAKPLEQFTRDELQQFTIMVMNSKMGMKDIILRGLKQNGVNDGKVEIPIPASHVFKVTIDCAAPDSEKIIFKDYIWGEWAVSGAVEDKNVPEELMLNLDFNRSGGTFEKDNYNLAIAITSNFSQSIGGCVTSFLINPQGIFTITQSMMRRRLGSGNVEVLYETRLINGKIHKKTKEGLLIPLIGLLNIGFGENSEF